MPRSSSPVGTANKASEATTPASLTAPILALNMTTCPSLSPVTHDKPSRGTRTNKGQPNNPQCPAARPHSQSSWGATRVPFCPTPQDHTRRQLRPLVCQKGRRATIFHSAIRAIHRPFFFCGLSCSEVGSLVQAGWLGTKKKILLERKESYVGSCSRYASLVLVF